MKFCQFLFLLGVCLLSYRSYSQQKTKLYYNVNWELVDPSGPFEYYRQCTLNEAGNFEGELTDFNTSDNKIMVGNYNNNVKHGVFTFFYPNGNVKSTGKYFSNIKSGEWHYFNSDGSMLCKIVYYTPINWKVLNTKGKEISPAIIQQNKSAFAKEVNAHTQWDPKFGKTEHFNAVVGISDEHYPALTQKFRKDSDSNSRSDSSQQQTEGQQKFEVVEDQPEFPGGFSAMQKFIYSNLLFPEEAKSLSIEGKVFVSFVINKDGSISDVEAVKGIGYGCDEEAVRVINMLPNWVPAKNRGIATRVKMLIPVEFKLSQE